MKILVTGGTGFVGREILWRLHETGHQIRLFSRRGSTDTVRQLAYRHRAELVAASFDDPASLAAAARDCEAVIHLVGIISEVGSNSFERVHVEATRALLSAAAGTGIKRFIHMSALGARPDARSRYHLSKWRAEESVRAGGLPWTIFRPSVIYGREDGFVNLLARIARWSPVIPIFGSGKNRLQPVAVEDVARAFVGALDSPLAVGQSYDLCGNEVFTMEQLWDVVLPATGRRRIKVHIPMGLARLQAACLEWVTSVAGRPSPLTRDQLLMLEEDNTGNPGPAAEEFQLPDRSFAEEIRKYLR